MANSGNNIYGVNVIVNGRKIGDTTGNLTCHKYNGSSLVDYFICDTNFFRVIQYMCVHDWLPHLSDHCSISLCLNINVKRGRSADNENLENAPRRMKWDAMREHVFKCKLQLPEIKAKILEISETQVGSNLDIDQMLDDTCINSILYKAGDINISKGRKPKKRRKQSRKEWFDEDLSKLKHQLISLGKAVTNDYSNMYLRGKFFSLKKVSRKLALERLISLDRPFWTIWRDLKIKIQKSTGSYSTN